MEAPEFLERTPRLCFLQRVENLSPLGELNIENLCGSHIENSKNEFHKEFVFTLAVRRSSF